MSTITFVSLTHKQLETIGRTDKIIIVLDQSEILQLSQTLFENKNTF